MSRGHKPVGFDTALTTRDINAICIYVMELVRMRIIEYKWLWPCILLFVISLVWKVNGLHIACVKQSVHGPEIARATVPVQGLQDRRPGRTERAGGKCVEKSAVLPTQLPCKQYAAFGTENQY